MAAARELFRAGRSGSESVLIGAYARRLRRRRLLMASLGAVLIAGALAVYAWFRPAQSTGPRSEYPVRLGCRSCDLDARDLTRPGEKFPRTCARCGERAVYPLWQCAACAHLFIPLSEQHPVRCPACQSVRVGSALPQAAPP